MDILCWCFLILQQGASYKLHEKARASTDHFNERLCGIHTDSGTISRSKVRIRLVPVREKRATLNQEYERPVQKSLKWTSLIETGFEKWRMKDGREKKNNRRKIRTSLKEEKRIMNSRENLHSWENKESGEPRLIGGRPREFCHNRFCP